MWKQAIILTALLWLFSAQAYSFHLLFAPLYAAILTSFFLSLIPLLLSDSFSQLSSLASASQSYTTLLLSHFFKSTTSIFLFSALLAFAEAEGEGVLHTSKLCILGALLSHLVDSLLSSEKVFSSGHIVYSSSALSNLLMTWTVACQGGMCYTLYVSTFTSVLGAFGVTVIDMVDILRPLQLILLVVFLISLYKAGKSYLYGPLWLGAAGASIILISLYIQDAGAVGEQDGESKRSGLLRAVDAYGVLMGNVVVVGSSLWNLRKQGVMGI